MANSEELFHETVLLIISDNLDSSFLMLSEYLICYSQYNGSKTKQGENYFSKESNIFIGQRYFKEK